MRTLRRFSPLVLLLAALAAGCGKDDPASAPQARVEGVSGSVSKGPLQGATVDFYAVDVAGNLSGSPLRASVTTDASGGFGPVTGLPAGAPILVKTSFGTYVDESDPETNPALRRRITFGSTDNLEAVLPAGATKLAITPYSMALLKKARVQAAGSNFANVYAAVHLQATEAFGFDPILTIPADPITGVGGSQAYALLLGAAALRINRIAFTGTPEHYPAYADVLAFIDDFSDGQLDGDSLPDLVRRFRNNNIGIYGGTDAPFVDEAALSQPATVPNSAPTITAIADQTISEGGATGALSFTVGDAEDAATALTVSGTSSNTALVPNANIVFGGSGASRDVTVTPVTDGFGTATITVTVTDTDGGTASESFLLTVTNINDPPVINSTALTTATEDTLYTYNATVNDTDGPAPTWSLGASHTCGGSINASSGVFTFTPAGPVPPASCDVQVQVTDGGSPVTQTTTVTITAVNDLPVINSTAPNTATEDTLYTYNATVNDPDGPSATWSLATPTHTCGGSIVPATGVFTFTPVGPSPPASCVVAVRVTDGGTPVTQSATVTISAVNDAPSINSVAPTTATEDTLYTYNATVSDPDGPAPTWSLGASHTCGGSIVPATGVFTFTPAGPVPAASCNVQVQVTDGGSPVTQTTPVTITAVNDPPTISDFPSGSIFEDGNTGSIDYTIGDGETALTALSFVATSGNQALVPDANFDYTDDGDGDGAFRDVTITPTANEYGSALITVTVTDGNSATAVDTFTLTVDPVSDAPSSQTFGIQTDEDLAYVFGTAEFNFSDAVDAAGDGSDEDSFDAVILTSLPLDGTLVLNDGAVDNPITVLPFPPISTSNITLGRFKFLPDPGESGIPYTSFTFQVQDTGSTANGGVIASIPYVLSVDVLPGAGSPEALLPYFTGTGDLKLFDPVDPGNPVVLELGLPTAGFAFRTLLKASGTGSTASSIHTSLLVYIRDDGSTRTLRKVNLESGQSHASVQVSNIIDACGINGVAEDIRNSGNSIVRIDTADALGKCQGDVGFDPNTAEAYLVPLTTSDANPGIQIGVGACCGISGITDADGVVTGVLTTEDDGTGSTFELNRRNVADLTTPIPVATLDIAGNGQIFANLVRGLGDEHTYVRASATGGPDNNYKLLRFNVASTDLTELYDYGVADASLFSGNFDDATFDANDLFFTSADGTSLLKIAHTATGLGATELVPSSAGNQIVRLEQAADRIVFEVEGPSGGVYSVPKTGGSALPLAQDNPGPPTFVSLAGTNGTRVFINSISGTAGPTYSASAIDADTGNPSSPITAAQWAGESFQTTCDFNSSCEDSISAAFVYLHRILPGFEARIDLADAATGAPTGDSLGSLFGTSEDPFVFGFGFGRFAQFTAFASGETDIYVGDTDAAVPPPAAALQLVSNDPGDDKWLLFGENGGDDGGGSLDSDFDGLTDAQEASLGTDPFNPDTDFDGLSDFEEVNRDGNPDDFNQGAGDTDPNNHDTDADGARDGEEVNIYSTDPLDPDSDTDDIGDGLEITYGSNPKLDDSFKLYVDGSGAGNDTNDGLSWATAIASNGEVANRQAALDSSRGPDGLVYVLYQGDPASPTVYPTFSFVINIPNAVFIGSLGPGKPVPPNWAGGPPSAGELGTAFDPSGDGGALEVSTAGGVVLDSLVLTGGSAFPDGGGLRISGGSSVVSRRLLVSGNQAGDGGGVSVGSSDNVALMRSTVENNFALGVSAGGRGGGIYNLGVLTLDTVRISGNTANRVDATNFGFGGGLYAAANSDALVRDSVVSNNTADGAGGGLFVATLSTAAFTDVIVESSTIDANQALRPQAGDSGGNGGGICASGPFTVIDSVVSNNTAEASFSLNGTLQGGGGINAFFGLVLDNSKVVGNRALQGAGGGVLAGNSTSGSTTVKNATFADNHAFGGPGGGLNLIDVANTVVRDSRFLSNSSSGFPGAGLHLHMAGNATIFNNLFAGNHSNVTNPGQPGGGVEIENFQSTPVLEFNSNTVAYNQIQIAGTAASGGMNVTVGSPTGSHQFRNNIVWFNDNADVGTQEAGENVVLDDLSANPVMFTTQAGNNVNESGFSGSINADPLLEQNFYLLQSSSPSVNGGDALFSDVFGAGTEFTTDVTGTEDAGQVDSGFHHLQASAGSFDSVALTPARSLSCASTDTFIFTPSFASAPNGEPGHLIVVELSGVTPTLGSLTTLDPRASGSRIARDLGDGRYAVTTTGFQSGSATGTFTVYADDQPTPQGFVLTFTNAC